MVKYTPSPDKKAQVEKAFTYHAPKEDQVERYAAICDLAKDVANLIIECTPISREQSVALTTLEEVVMWANAAIARNE